MGLACPAVLIHRTDPRPPAAAKAPMGFLSLLTHRPVSLFGSGIKLLTRTVISFQFGENQADSISQGLSVVFMFAVFSLESRLSFLVFICKCCRHSFIKR